MSLSPDTSCLPQAFLTRTLTTRFRVSLTRCMTSSRERTNGSSWKSRSLSLPTSSSPRPPLWKKLDFENDHGVCGLAKELKLGQRAFSGQLSTRCRQFTLFCSWTLSWDCLRRMHGNNTTHLLYEGDSKVAAQNWAHHYKIEHNCSKFSKAAEWMQKHFLFEDVFLSCE